MCVRAFAHAYVCAFARARVCAFARSRVYVRLRARVFMCVCARACSRTRWISHAGFHCALTLDFIVHTKSKTGFSQLSTGPIGISPKHGFIRSRFRV